MTDDKRKGQEPYNIASTNITPLEDENLLEEADEISLDELGEFDKSEDLSDDTSSNDGGTYPPEETFDQDSPGFEAGTPGHPGIDEGTG